MNSPISPDAPGPLMPTLVWSGLAYQRRLTRSSIVAKGQSLDYYDSQNTLSAVSIDVNEELGRLQKNMDLSSVTLTVPVN